MNTLLCRGVISLITSTLITQGAYTDSGNDPEQTYEMPTQLYSRSIINSGNSSRQNCVAVNMLKFYFSLKIFLLTTAWLVFVSYRSINDFSYMGFIANK